MSDRRKTEERLHRLAHYDPLTTLPNRITIRNKLDEATESGATVTVLMLDLDGFKEVNDTLGHASRDMILKAAGDRLRACIRERGLVGRLGGDEFAALLPGLSDPLKATGICEELIESFHTPFAWEEQEAYLGLSIGIAMSPSHGESAEDLLANADFALYRAKASSNCTTSRSSAWPTTASPAPKRFCAGVTRSTVLSGPAPF
ncbi:MAG TPA: GGDEF domain-containing protein [Methyloceanibacter sp.]|nr:GGDEF domain-containing protein [Methyloceanibacter sp.]